jgi:hypothetical protein
MKPLDTSRIDLIAKSLLAGELNFLKTSISSTSDSGHRREDLDKLSELYRANRNPDFIYALVTCMVICREKHITRAIAAFLRILRSHSAVRAFIWLFPRMNAYQVEFAVHATEVMRDNRLIKVFHRVMLMHEVPINAKCVCCEHIGRRLISKRQYVKMTPLLEVGMRGEAALRFSCVCVVVLCDDHYRPFTILRSMLADAELEKHAEIYDRLFGLLGEKRYFAKISRRLWGKTELATG